jgi:ATP-dependent DNA helicase RecG
LLFTSSTRRLIEGGKDEVISVQLAKERIARGRMVLVGTHALIEREQTPPDLALAVVDEQHRFGVSQREALVVEPRNDGLVPHLLSMTATPIPRSLALTLFGDLDVSIIRSKPKNRASVSTHVILGEEGRNAAYERIRNEIKAGHRAFIVCPLIDPSDKLGVKSVEEETRRIASGPLRGLRIEMVHGRMSVSEKDEAMSKFANGEADVLVATTVVEVGVDVPLATVMLVEGAERFGLAQLHQLRGRVGRSSHPSFCFLAASEDGLAFQRLRVMERTTDGFEVAEADLRLRGEGNLLGVQQSGQAVFSAARTDDLSLMATAKECSQDVLKEDPKLEKYPMLKEAVTKLRETSHRE